MSPHLVYAALGTNLGDRPANLKMAVEALSRRMKVVRESPVYETEPWGYTDQPAFLNQVLEMEAGELTPLEVLRFFKEAESELGRTPSFRYGPRLIDIDLLIYDDVVMDTPELTLPHPRLAERAFVLVPLGELAPQWVHPSLGLSVRDLLQKVGRNGVNEVEL